MGAGAPLGFRDISRRGGPLALRLEGGIQPLLRLIREEETDQAGGEEEAGREFDLFVKQQQSGCYCLLIEGVNEGKEVIYVCIYVYYLCLYIKRTSFSYCFLYSGW